MSGKRRKHALWIVAAVLLLLITGAVGIRAQTGDPFDLTWNTVDGGGGMFSSGGDFTLGGTIGQPDAGFLSGGDFGLSGGFWVVWLDYHIYLPFVLRNH